jgi:hypothetical protein
MTKFFNETDIAFDCNNCYIENLIEV